MRDSDEVLYAPFDIDTHKKTFKNYLEVVLLEDGTPEYAVPSHQEKAISIGMEKRGMSREEFYHSCPREYWCDVMKWLHIETGVVFVWNDGIVGRPNAAQADTLKTLSEHGLYYGFIPVTT